MNAELMRDAKISWTKVASAISNRLGRRYAPGYVQEVASGHRTNHTITQLCRAMGVPLGPQRLSIKEHNQMLAQSCKDVLAREAAGTLRPVIDEVALLTRQRRTLASHLRDALRESRALRAELDEAQSRTAATALRLGNEIAEKVTDIDILHNHIAAVTSDRDILRQRLDEARHANDRLAARLSKQARTRRVTHIQIGSELFRNRTGVAA